MRSVVPLLLIVGSLAVVGLTGCGSNGLVPATGVVLLDGQPLAQATITIIPDEIKSRPAQALSQEDGTFQLRTGNTLGALVGSYRVLVAKDEPAGERAAGVGSGTLRDTLGQGMEQIARFPRHSLIPKRYDNPVESPLKCQVPAGGTRELKFELTSNE